MTTVKELIKELQKYDEDSIVLYAYNENGDTGVHHFIAGGFTIAIDKDDSPVMELGELVEIETDSTNGMLEGLELIVKRDGTLKPAIKLFCR